MDGARKLDDEQAMLWNGPAGRAWVESQELLDRMFAPIEELLAGPFASGSARRVLDVGCGTGATTLAVARLLGEQGQAVGIDISAPMIEAARARAQRAGVPATFLCASAQAHAFEAEQFDALISRFGVMFFDDPVGAFANLRRAAVDGAELRFVAWRSAAENPFMTTAERAAAPLLPNLPARRPDAPGQFAFADQRRVLHILEESGWDEITVRPLDFACVLPERELSSYVSRLGPLGLVLQQTDGATRERIVRSVREAFEPYVHGAEVRFTAACWLVEARAAKRAAP